MALPAPRRDGRLWATALGLSLLVNAGILLIAGFATLKSQEFRKTHPIPSPPVEVVTTVTISPEIVAVNSNLESVPRAPEKPRFARTAADQTAATPPDKAAFIGERDTKATSDRSPDAKAPPLPSQAGIEPTDRENLETTQSDYQDGHLASDQTAKPQALMEPTPPPPTPNPALVDHTSSGEKMEIPANDDSKSSPSPRHPFVDGPNPVDIPVSRDVAENSEIKPSSPKHSTHESSAPSAADSTKTAVSKPANDPGFRGYQRKTAIVGSISRTGRSALDVADSPLGRYQAVISRAVEQEWQRNCVRHRDFITPGFLTVRFFVESSGRVRTVQFVGNMETGEVQKGFTLNAIRDAEIPSMPSALKKDFAKEPLELIFNFYF